MSREKTPIQKQQEKELRKIDLSMEVWNDAKQELYLSMRFFDVALSRLRFVPDVQVEGFGTDGAIVYYRPERILSMYLESRIKVNRAYLHMVFHCLFLHWNVPEEVDKRYWDLACDIVTESLIDTMSSRSVRIYVPPKRKNLYQTLREKHHMLTPKNVYRMLLERDLSDIELFQLEQEFFVDDHRMWNDGKTPKELMERQRQWKEDSEKVQTEMETFGKEASQQEQSILEQVQVENRERYDYRKFLRKFAVLKEEMTIDEDSFDYIFYHYGMEHYGNMPLIEPQETKEVHKIEDFVIAIDTSMSCKGDLVKKFLEETYSVLQESESFFRKVHVHILQCDDQVRSDVLVTKEEEMRNYMEHFEIHGQGGTDFRPVFEHVNTLVQQKAFHRLKGLIYFTDGYGIYPVKRPLYETAFVFMKEDYQDVDVPVWAMKLILEEEDLDRKVDITWT